MAVESFRALENLSITVGIMVLGLVHLQWSNDCKDGCLTVFVVVVGVVVLVVECLALCIAISEPPIYFFLLAFKLTASFAS